MKDYIKYNYFLNRTSLSFFEILNIRSQLRDENPFENVGCFELWKKIFGNNRNLIYILKEEDFEKIKFVIIDDFYFDGNLDFLGKCVNIEYVYVCGINGKGKTKDLTPLQNLKKIKYLDINYSLINDLTPISNLTEIEELYLLENPLKTIKPICHFKKLKKLKLHYNNLNYNELESYAFDENDILELKSNSPSCKIN
jgi:internalin A